MRDCIASTLPFSVSDNSDLSSKILNEFWLGSLVLAIASALHSFLAAKMLTVIT